MCVTDARVAAIGASALVVRGCVCSAKGEVRTDECWCSGEGEEQLFQFGFGHRLLVVTVVAGEALTESGGDELEAGFVQGTGDGGELGDDVFAFTAVFDMEITPAS